MKTAFTKTWLPVLWFLVAVSTVVHYERHWETDAGVFFDGFGTGITLSVILAIALAIRIFRRVEDILIARGTIKGRVSTPYDLFPVLLIPFFAFGLQLHGNLLPSAATSNKLVWQWAFEWGQNEYKLLIYFSILGLILLYRIHQLLAAVIQKG